MRKFFQAAGMGVAVALMLVGCAVSDLMRTVESVKAPDGGPLVALNDTELTLSEVAAYSEELECNDLHYWSDDLYSYAPMKGFDCVSSIGFLTFRAYDSRSAMLNRVSDWTDLISREKSIVVGQNWFAFGDSSIVSKVADRVGIEATVSRLPQPPRPSDREARIRACNIVIVSAARGLEIDRSVDVRGDIEYDDVFPRSKSIAADISTRMSVDEANFEYEIVSYAGEIRGYCESL